MRLDSKLAKLERDAKATLRCAWCRFILVDTPPSQVKAVAANPLDYVPTVCAWCGNSYSLNLTGLTEHQREAVLIYYGKENGEIYTDKRVAAANTWFHASLVVASWKDGKLQKQFEREERKVTSHQTYQQQRAEEKRKQALAAKPQAKIKERAYAFYRKMAQREEKLYAPAKHNLQVEIDALAHLQINSFGYAPEPHKFVKMSAKEKAIRTVIYKASVMQVCEVVIWGKVLPVTAEIIKHAKNLAQSFVEERDHKQREKEEAERLRQEERERERLERETRTAAGRSHHPPAPMLLAQDTSIGAISRQIPADDGRDPLYYRRLQYYRESGVWPDNRMLGVY